MKFFGCFFLFVLFLCAIAALLLLQQKIPKEITQIPPVPQTEPPGPPPKTKPQPEITYRPGMALREFQGDDLPDRFHVSYGFIDFLGSPHRISCEISKTDHARES